MKMGTRPKVFLAATASLTALAASPAFAQTGDAIIVTGSRIAKSGFTRPDPIQINAPQTDKLQGQVQLAELPQSHPATRPRAVEGQKMVAGVEHGDTGTVY